MRRTTWIAEPLANSRDLSPFLVDMTFASIVQMCRKVADANFADAAQVSGMLSHWEKALIEIGFLDPDAPKKLMPRLNQLFNRANLSPEEIHILRGVAKAMIETAQAKR